MSMTIIENDCKEYAELRGRLRKKFEAKQKAQAALDDEHNEGIRNLQGQCDQTRDRLEFNLNASRSLFAKKKSQTFFGITVGFKKGQDKIVCPDNEAVLVQRIETMLPAAQGKTLLDRTVTVIKSAFKKLPLSDLQKLGCSKMSGADTVIVHPGDDDIETLVRSALGQAKEVQS